MINLNRIQNTSKYNNTNNTSKYKYCVFYDCGHGGMSNGDYTTAPSKMFKFDCGKYHNNGNFYEGLKNRYYGKMVMNILRERGINVIPVFNDYIDTPLSTRVNIANVYNNNIQKGIFISEHSNATKNHNAKGFSIWTSRGETTSDVLAEMFYTMYRNEFISKNVLNTKVKRIKTLHDLSDGDYDYEANFYVLKQTYMPAVLLENLFFDQAEDAKLLMSRKYQEIYCNLQADWIEKCLSYMELKHG